MPGAFAEQKSDVLVLQADSINAITKGLKNGSGVGEASGSNVKDWYEARLSSLGYGKVSEREQSGGNDSKITSSAFFLPSKPLITIQVDVAALPSGRSIFILPNAAALMIEHDDEFAMVGNKRVASKL